MIDPETIIDGRYRVISRLGSGGMADVYLAQDQLLGREVAVKVLHHHFAEDQEFVLYHTDGIESMGFSNHWKLPHYVDFLSDLDRLRKAQENHRASA